MTDQTKREAEKKARREAAAELHREAAEFARRVCSSKATTPEEDAAAQEIENRR